VSVNVAGVVQLRADTHRHWGCGFVLEDRMEELGHDDNLFPGDFVDFEGFSEDALGLAVGVYIGGVEGVYSVIEAVW